MAKKCGEAIDSHCAAVPAPRALFGAFSAFFATRRKKAESHPQRACAVSERLSGIPKSAAARYRTLTPRAQSAKNCKMSARCLRFFAQAQKMRFKATLSQKL